MEQDTKTQPETETAALSKSSSVHRYQAEIARKRPSRDEVKAQLDAKSADISARIASIQSDVFGGTRKVQDLVTKSPLVPLVGSLVGGVVVGLIFGGSRAASGKARPISGAVAEELVSRIREADESGKDPVDAAEETLRQFVGSGGESPKRSTGIARAVGGLLVNLAVRQAIAYVEGRLAGEPDQPQDSSGR